MWGGYVNQLNPITAVRAMQCIRDALHSGQSDKDKLKTIQTYSDAWVYEKPEPVL